MDEDWQVLSSLLPSDWREQAAEHGALKGLRKDKSPDALLRTLLMHPPQGCDYVNPLLSCSMKPREGSASVTRNSFTFRIHHAKVVLCLNVPCSAARLSHLNA